MIVGLRNAVAARRYRLARLGVRAPRAGPAALLAAVAVAVAAVVAPGPGAERLRWPPGTAPSSTSPSRAVAAFLDVGQGDATLLAGGGRAVLIDTGPPGGAALARLTALGVRGLDGLAITHPDSDHAGGAAEVAAALPVGALLDPEVRPDSRALADVRAVLAGRGVPTVALQAGDTFAVGPWRVDVLHAGAGRAYAGRNDGALVVRATVGRVSVILPADAESNVTGHLGLGPATVLRIAHHGSADRGLPALLARVRPAVVVVSDGGDNPYGHPTAQALGAAVEAGAGVLRTDRDGTVLLAVDDPDAGRWSLWRERSPSAGPAVP